MSQERTLEKIADCQKCKDKDIPVYAADSQDFAVEQYTWRTGKYTDNQKPIVRHLCNKCLRG